MSNRLSIWQQPEIISWSQILANSYQRLFNKPLINSNQTPEALSEVLFNAPFVIVSHGIEADPIFNYGNQTALQLWSISWDKLIKTPSRLSAEAENRETRAKMLEQAATKGYIDNYQGIRISTTGQRFAIAQAIIWNLSDEQGQSCGQAATFSQWIWL